MRALLIVILLSSVVSAQPVGTVTPERWSPIVPQTFGAIGDGTQDDTAAIQAAIDAADSSHPLYLPPGSYLISSELLVDATYDGIRIYGAGRGISRLVCAEDWINDALLQVDADNCIFENFSIEETNSSPTNADKSGAANVAIDVDGAGNTFRNIFVDGFGYCVVLRDTNADGSSDGNKFDGCEFQEAYSWGVEVDGSQNISFVRCESHDCGLDGFKLQNEHTRTCNGFRMDLCESHSNGQRDTAAGGSEDTNGNGIDLFDGGLQFMISNSRFYSNYGAGLVIKGPSPGQPEMGQGVVSGCQFNSALGTNTAADQHGVEIGTTGSNSGMNLKFIGCVMKDNSGDGVFHGGGIGNSFISCTAIGNRYGFNLQGGSVITLTGCNSLGSTDATVSAMGIRIGSSNDSSFASRDIMIRGGLVAGQYDPDIADDGTCEDADTAITTNRGAQIFSDSADITFDSVTFCAFELYQMLSAGARVTIRDCRFVESPELGIQVSAGSGAHKVTDCFFGNALQELTFTTGNGTEPSPGDAASGSGSGATGVVKRVDITSGTFAGGDAAGVIQVGNTSGLFLTSDTLNLPSTTTAAISAREDYRGIRLLGGRGVFTGNEFVLENNRADGDGIYIDSSSTAFQIINNQYTNIVDEITVEASSIPLGQATAANADATPTVLETTVLITANTGTTTVTDFDDGIEGQTITVVIDGNTTVQDNANISLSAGADFVDAQGGTIVLRSRAGVWEELSRTGF